MIINQLMIEAVVGGLGFSGKLPSFSLLNDDETEKLVPMVHTMIIPLLAW